MSSNTIIVLHLNEETMKYADGVYEADGWGATGYTWSRELNETGGGQDTLTPKRFTGRTSSQNTVEAYLSSYNFKPLVNPRHRQRFFIPPADVRSHLQREVTFSEIITQLNAVFKEPIPILRFLAKEGGFLGGSEALQAFVSGATDENSDMDFYINGASVTEMMLLLAKHGVSWLQSTADQFDDDLKAGGCPISNALLRYIRDCDKGLENNISDRDLYTFYMAASFRELIDQYAELIVAKYVATDGTTHNIMEFDRETVKNKKQEIEEAIRGKETPSQVGADHSPCPTCEKPLDGDRNTVYGSGMMVLNGKVQMKNGRTKRVQLISHRYNGENKSSLFESLANMWAGHVQVFIGGWCAGHMNYDAAKKRKMCIWRLKNQNPESVGKAIGKYRQRGFVEAYENQPHWRSLFDEKSYFIDFSHEVFDVQAKPDWWLDRNYFQKLYNTTVTEITNREEEAKASGNDELWLTNRRANLVSIKWQNVGGHTHYPNSTLFLENLFRWAW